MTIEVIIPNYNGLNLLKKNLPKVLTVMKTYKNYTVTVVDDGSTDESCNYVSELMRKFKHLSLITNKVNKGFAGSVNSAGLKSKADIIVLLNTDVAPLRRFLDPVIEDFDKDEHLFGVGFLDKSIERNNVVLRGRGIGKFEKGFLVHAAGEVDKNNTLWVSGGSCALRRELFVKLGGFDELYNPFYWEDIDLSYRAQKAGYRVLFEKKSVVEHRHEQGSIKSSYSHNKIKVIVYRNQFIFVWKNITDFDLTILHFLYIPYHIMLAILRLDYVFLYGFVLAIMLFPVIILKRFTNTSLITLTDKEILKRYIE